MRILCGFALLVGACAADSTPDRTFFDRNVEPLLSQKCAGGTSGCHSESGAAGNLDVTSYDSVSQRRDLFAPYSGSSYSLFLIKSVGPRELTFPDGSAIDVPHAAPGLLGVGSDAFLLLQEWIDNGATETGLP
jgi:hypothetical protein